METTSWQSGSRNSVIMAVVAVLAVIVPGFVLSLPAQAAAPDPNITATVVLTSAGTGYCDPGEMVTQPNGEKTCPTASFVNSQNGFVPGADGPAGGVVASGDYANYLSTVTIGAGPGRTVQVVYNFPEWLEFDPSVNAGLCVTNRAVTGKLLTTGVGNQAVCEYTAQAWQPASVQSTLSVTAKDTAGLAMRGQITSVSTRASATDDYFATVNAKAVTVVSAPAADLVLRPSQCAASGQCQALDASKPSATIHVEVHPLSYSGWANKGASIATQWSGWVDITSFPDGTEWYLREVGADESARIPAQIVEETDAEGNITSRRIRIDERSGPVDLDYVTPVVLDEDGEPDVQEAWGGSDDFAGGATKGFAVHIIPDAGAFDTVDYQNNGTGWEPGENEPADFSTANQNGSGAREGYLTPNNDWTVSQVIKPQPGCKANPENCFFNKEQFRPWNPSETLWEPGNQQFNNDDSAGGVSVWVSPKTSFQGSTYDTQGVTKGTRVNARLNLDTSKIPAPTEQTDPLFVASDQWNPTEQAAFGPIKVIAPDGSEVTSGFTVQWSRTNGGSFDSALCSDAGKTCGFDSSVADPTLTDGWITSLTPPSGARAVRVIFDNPSLPLKGEDGAGTYYVLVPMEILDIDNLNPIPAQFVDKSYFWYGGKVFAPPQKQVTPVSTPIPEIGVSITANPADTVDPADYTVDYTIKADIAHLTSSKNPVSGQITVSLDPCVTNIELLSDAWEIVSIDYGTHCMEAGATKGTVVLQPKAPAAETCPAGFECPAGSWIPSSMNGGVAALPPIELHATVSRLSVGEVNASVEWKLTDREVSNGAGYADDNVTVTTQEDAAINEFLYPLTPVEEVNDQLVWEAVLQGTEIKLNEEGLVIPSEAVGTATVVAMPTNDADKNADYKQNYQDANAGVVYGGVADSAFHGSYTLVAAAVVPEDSVEETTLYCTTQPNPTLDPTADIFEPASVVEGVQTCTDPATTAIKIEQAKGFHLGISTVRITLAPTGNEIGDRYLMWIGPQQIGDGESLATGGMAPPKVERIVSSEVSGAVYWDQTGTGTDYVPGDPLIGEVDVLLCGVGKGPDWDKQVQASVASIPGPGQPGYQEALACRDGDTPIAYTQTEGPDEAGEGDSAFARLSERVFATLGFDAAATEPSAPSGQQSDDRYMPATRADGDNPDFNYQFQGLHSGDYYTVIAGYPVQVPSKVDPNRDIDVEETLSFSGQKLSNAKPYSTNFTLPVGTYSPVDDSTGTFVPGDRPGVNFGFFAPDPYSDLQKSVSAVQCPEFDPDDPTSNVCDITWQVEVVSSAVAQIPGRVVQVSGDYINGMAVTANGDVYTWGSNQFGQLGQGTAGGVQLTPKKVDSLSGKGIVKINQSPGQAMFAITRYGEVYGWGINNAYQLTDQFGRPGVGSGRVDKVSTPTLIEGLPPVKDIVNNARSTFAITKNGDVYAWGGGAPGYRYGQLGLGAGTDTEPTPTKISGLSNVVTMAANEASTYALTAAGDLYAWGMADFGLLAGAPSNGTKSDPACSNIPADGPGCAHTPQLVPDFTGGVGLKQLAAGRYATAALDNDGNIWTWGGNNTGQLGSGYQATGGEMCTGSVIGSGTTQVWQCKKTPSKITTPDGVSWSGVAMGYSSGVAVTTAGDAYTWGQETSGQLGLGQNSGTKWDPTQVTLPDGITAQDVSLRHRTVQLLATDGQVAAWGVNQNAGGDPASGAVGNGTSADIWEPVLVTPTWVTESMTYDYASSLGSNIPLTGGELYDTTSERVYDVEAYIGQTVKAVVAGTGSGLARTNTGQVWQWGSNYNAQTGAGTTNAGQSTPVLAGWNEANGVQGKIVQQLLTNGQAYAVTDEGTVYVTGTNQYGRQGLGYPAAETKVTTPQAISFPDDAKIKQVAGSKYTTYAVSTTGEVYVWGFNRGGTFGDGTFGSTNDTNPPASALALTPKKIPGLSNIAQVTAAEGFAIALSNDGSVYGWGGNHNGRILGYCLNPTVNECAAPDAGNGEGIVSPVLVGAPDHGDLPPLAEVAASGVGVIGRTVDGRVYTWGLNTYGSQGNGLGSKSGLPLACDGRGADWIYEPHQITGIPTVTSIAGGLYHFLALTADGQVYAWGSNDAGQLGRGTEGGCSSDALAVPTISGATAIASSGAVRYSFAIVSGGILGWGQNRADAANSQDATYSQLGNNTEVKNLPTPTPVVDTWNNNKITLTVKEITHQDGWVERVYDLPDIEPGESITVTITGKVNRPGKAETGDPMTGFTLGNQAVYTSDQTPRNDEEGKLAIPETPSLASPAPGGQSELGQPQGKPFDEDKPWVAGKWPHGPAGASGCDATLGWIVPGDQCDAVWASVPGSANPVGSLSGKVWSVPDGTMSPQTVGTVYDPLRDIEYQGVKVTLYWGTPTTPGTIAGLTKIGSTATDGEGNYRFEDLLPGANYYVVFERPDVPEDGHTWVFVDPGTYAEGSDTSIADPIYGITPAMSVEGDKNTPNVDAGLWWTNSEIRVTKQGMDSDYQFKNEILVPFSPVQADPRLIMTYLYNEGNEPIGDLIFDDTTVAGNEVQWSSCSIESTTFTTNFAAGDVLPYHFPAGPDGWVMAPGQHMVCIGFLDAFAPYTANGVHEDTVTFTGTSVISGALLQDDDTFTEKTNPETVPSPGIAVEKGLLVNANGDGQCPAGAVHPFAPTSGDQLDDSCWIKDAVYQPGTEKTITFRIWNTGGEPLVNPMLDDEVTQGSAIISQVTRPAQGLSCPWPDEWKNGSDIVMPPRASDTDPFPFIDCTATLIFDQTAIEHHQDVAGVTATGQYTGSLVEDDSQFDADTVPNLGGLPLAGGSGWLVRLLIGVVVIGGFAWVWRVSRRREVS